MIELQIRESSSTKSISFGEACEIVKLVSDEKFGPEASLVKLLELIVEMVRHC